MKISSLLKCTLTLLFIFQGGLYMEASAMDKRTFNVLDFGAVPDGKTLNTQALQEAIDAAFKNGGGRVVLPEGIFLTGSIVLRNGVELYLEDDAKLLGSTNPAHYTKMNNWGALILAENAFQIAIRGKGTIDGQGRALALNVDSLHHLGEMVDPRYNQRRMRPSEYYRPQLIYMLRCKEVRVSGLSLKNASCWVQTYEQCTDVEIDQIKVESRAFWNNDGFDIVDCKNVRVTGCDVNSADDGICLKSHSPDHFNDQIYIANCTVRSSASAVKFGTASYGGFKNVVIENIKVFDTFRSAIAIESVDGGLIENIKVSNITAVNTWNAIFLRLGHRAGDGPGTVKNISIKDVNVQVPFGRPDIGYDMRGPEVDFFHNLFPSSIAGIPGHNIENVVLENIQITYPGRASKGMAYVPLSRLDQVPEQVGEYPEYSMFHELPAWGFYVRHAKGIQMKNITLKLEDRDFRPAFVFDDVDGLSMHGIDLPAESSSQIVFWRVKNVDLDDPASAQVNELGPLQ
jgi:hypothetical protein